METYLIIQGYENYYISNLGNVKNIVTGRAMKCNVNSRGVLVVGLVKDKKQKMLTVKNLFRETYGFEINKYHILKHQTDRRFLKRISNKVHNPISITQIEFNPKPIIL